MKKILLGTAVLTMTLASCQNEKMVSCSANDLVSVKAVMGAESRTEVNNAGSVTWTAGDIMLVWGGETEGVLTLEGNGGGIVGTFSGFVQGTVAELTTAFYPAEIADGKGNVNLSEVTFPNSNSPMVAAWNKNGLQFSHLAGMLRISVTGLAGTNNTLTVKGLGIAGKATLSNGKLTGFSSAEETVIVKGIPAGNQVIDVPVFATEELSDVTLEIAVNGGEAVEIQSQIKVGAMKCLYLALGTEGLKVTDTYTGWYDADKTEFTLRTAEDLKGLAALVNDGTDNFAGKTITLGNDVDLEGVEWTPIGTGNTSNGKPFVGTFDGQKHFVRNLKVQESMKCAGFFGHLRTGGIVKNLCLENVNVIALAHVGAVVGYAYTNTTVENCSVNGGTIVADPMDKKEGCNAGAIIGMSQGTIKECEVRNVVVKGYRQIGSLVGYAQAGALEDNKIIDSVVIQDVTIEGDNKADVAEEIGHVTGAENIENSVENVIVIKSVKSLEENPNIFINVTEDKYYVFTQEDFEYLVNEGIDGENITLLTL